MPMNIWANHWSWPGFIYLILWPNTEHCFQVTTKKNLFNPCLYLNHQKFRPKYYLKILTQSIVPEEIKRTYITLVDFLRGIVNWSGETFKLLKQTILAVYCFHSGNKFWKNIYTKKTAVWIWTIKNFVPKYHLKILKYRPGGDKKEQ